MTTMADSILEQLSKMSVVVADTGDINSIQKYKPRDATTNPSLITAAAQMPEYAAVVDEALGWAKLQAGGQGGTEAIVDLAIDRLAVEFGLRILKIVPGRVSTEVDARLSHDTEATIKKARYLIDLYKKAGVGTERVLIKIAATWEGVRAAEVLEKEGIHCNLTLVFGLHQAIACAEAGVRLISPFVGRILDWYKKSTGKESYPPAEDPGVVSVTQIYNYYKKFGHKTEVMGASFRNTDEIIELAGCDLLTISPQLLEKLSTTQGTLARKLDPGQAASMDIKKIPMDQANFVKMHAESQIATDKLAEGIDGFSKALVQLEKLIEDKLKKAA
jgi:transaldolase